MTVNYATANGTATRRRDYTAAAAGTLTFAPGETTKTVTVAVNGDTLDEADETFTVNLSAATNATIADGQGVGTITDDDPTPPICDRRRDGRPRATAARRRHLHRHASRPPAARR